MTTEDQNRRPDGEAGSGKQDPAQSSSKSTSGGTDAGGNEPMEEMHPNTGADQTEVGTGSTPEGETAAGEGSDADGGGGYSNMNNSGEGTLREDQDRERTKDDFGTL